MPVQAVQTIICDGCVKDIPEQPLYPVYMVDQDDNRIFFHDHDCLILWAQKQKVLRDKKLEVAHAHKELHALLSEKMTPEEKEKYQFDINPDPVMPGSVEQLSLEKTTEEIERLKQE